MTRPLGPPPLDRIQPCQPIRPIGSEDHRPTLLSGLRSRAAMQLTPARTIDYAVVTRSYKRIAARTPDHHRRALSRGIHALP